MQPKSLDLQNTILIVSVIIFLLVSFIGFVLVLYHYRRKKMMNDLSKQFAQTLLESQLEIKEQTLQYISTELHDNLGQIASLIKINLNTLQLNDAAKAVPKIEETKELARQLIGDIKALSVSLGANRIGQLGLVKALETEVQRFNRTGQFTASFSQQGVMPEIDQEKTIILFRMSQEVLNNVLKHSAAKTVTVSTKAVENSLILAFADDGVGFDVNDAKNHQGSGLLNLQNRAKLIRAQISINSSPGEGTKIKIELPM